MSEQSRRRFLQGLGLTVGAPLLLPIADTLTRRAYGRDEGPRKRFIVMSVYMMESMNYLPDDVVREHPRDTVAPMTPATWPAMFGPLAGHMSRAVFVDGLRNYIGTCQHRAGTCALSCVRPLEGNAEAMGPAGGPTIDQHIGAEISDGAPFRSLNWGIAGSWHSAGARTGSGIYAAGPDQNLPHYTHAEEMLTQVFGEVGGELSVTNEFRPLRDRLMDDVARLHMHLAPEERIGLEAYEEAVLAYDERQEALANISCTTPKGGVLEDAQDHLESFMAQSTLALQCGLTNVIGASIGTSNSHNTHQPSYREVHERTSEPDGEASFYGHGGQHPENLPFRLEAKRHYHEIHLRELARMLDGLALIQENDGSSMLDNTVLAYASGNAMNNQIHHAAEDSKGQWPVLLVAGDAIPMNTGGRYMGCSMHEAQGEKWALTDVFAAVSAALGVDPAGFGDAEHGTGPFELLLS